MKIYTISNKEFNTFYYPEISCNEGCISDIPFIFDREPVTLDGIIYENTWLDSCFKQAQDEFPEIQWQIIEVKVEKIGELNEIRRS